MTAINIESSEHLQWLSESFHQAVLTGKFTYTGWSTSNIDDSERIWLNDAPIYVINLVGSRKCSKTHPVFASVMLLMSQPFWRTRIICPRLYASGASETMNSFIETLQFYGYPESFYTKNIRYSERKIKINWTAEVQNETFPLDNLIEFKSLYSNYKQDKPQLGATRSNNYHFEILLSDEISQLYEKKGNIDLYKFVKDAYGGANHRLQIKISNPWSIKNEYIKDCNSIQPFSEEKIKRDIVQFKYVNGEIYYYAQWRANPFLKEDDIREQLETETKDPQLARVSCYGLPGIEQGVIFQGSSKYISYGNYCENDYEYIRKYCDGVVIGIDYGMKKDPFTMMICGIVSGRYKKDLISKVIVFDKLYFETPKNQHLDDEQLATNCILKINQLQSMIRAMTPATYVFIDVSAVGFIQTFQHKVMQMGLEENIIIQEALRWQSKEGKEWMYRGPLIKIQELRRIMCEGCLMIDDNKCSELVEEINTWAWKENIADKDIPEDKNNHCIDGLLYAICQFFGQISKYN